MLLAEHMDFAIAYLEFKRLGVVDEVVEMKPAEVPHKFSIRCFGEEQEKAESLHPEAMREDDDVLAGRRLGETSDHGPDTLQETGK